MGRCKTQAQHMLFAFFHLFFVGARRSCLFYCTLPNKVKLIFKFYWEMAIYGKLDGDLSDVTMLTVVVQSVNFVAVVLRNN